MTFSVTLAMHGSQATAGGDAALEAVARKKLFYSTAQYLSCPGDCRCQFVAAVVPNRTSAKRNREPAPGFEHMLIRRVRAARGLSSRQLMRRCPAGSRRRPYLFWRLLLAVRRLRRVFAPVGSSPMLIGHPLLVCDSGCFWLLWSSLTVSWHQGCAVRDCECGMRLVCS